MAKKNIYEVFNEFKAASTKKDRIDVLRKNETWALRSVLVGGIDKKIEFDIDNIPEYKIEEVPPGMSYNHINNALTKVYLFMKNNPRTPAGLTEERKKQLLIQLLESMEPPEAEVYCNMIKKDLKIPYLTEALVNEAFEGLLSKP
jgi:hypothetical protein